MNINVVQGKGEGRTLLSSFDAALKDAGVYNYNLICLSSVLPPGVIVKDIGKVNYALGQHGDKLYIVMAQERSDTPGTAIGAGIGWYQFDESGAGILVEHETHGTSEQEVQQTLQTWIKNSIQDLCEFRGFVFSEQRLHSSISLTTVKDKPASVCVIAVFQHESWT